MRFKKNRNHKTNTRWVALLGSILMAVGLGAAESPTGLPLHVAKSTGTQPPVIDGEISEAAWQGATRSAIQRQHHDEEPLPEGERNVGFWMATWDAENLYIAADILDEHVNGLQSNQYEPHNDVLEVFFDPLLNYQFNLQYRVWPFGKDGSAAEVSQDPTWGRWEVASVKTEMGYRTEIRVPLAHFMEVAQVDLQQGDLIGFDLSVHDAPFPTGEQWLPPKVTGWSGDGTNWQYASQNGLLALGDPTETALASVRPHREDIGETPDGEAMALWPRIKLVEGFFNLDVNRQSWSWESYEPWRLGRIRHALVDTRKDGDIRTVNRTVGPHAHGEAIESRPRVVELSLSGQRDGKQEELTVLTTPFHPATSYRTSSTAITLFDEMETVGQPTGPSFVALPLQSGVKVRSVDTRDGVLYDGERDGALAEGWVLVWFARADDPRATDFPMIVYPNRSPKAISVTPAGGLEWTFEGTARNALTLLPLQGIAAVEKATTQAWTKRLPESVVERIRVWQRRSLRLPLSVREYWQYLPERHAFQLRHRFAYSENLSQWPIKESLIAPLPLLLSSFDAIERFPATELVDLEYPLYQGQYYGVLGEAEIEVELPAVDLDRLPPSLDRARLERSELGRKYLKQLDELDLASIFDANMDRVMARPHFMPHIWPMIDKPDLFSGYPLIAPARRQALINRVENGYDEIIFSPDWESRLWPTVSPYLGSDFRYGNLTYPYGVAEPYYGVVEMLSKMNYFCDANDDYSAMVRHWDRIKELVEVIWYGGFTQYRYDGGTMLGEALIGLVKGAEIAGDLKMKRRAMLRLAQHAASAAGYLEGGERLAKHKSWALRGKSPVLMGQIQQTTPSTAAAIDDGSLSGSDGTFYWDRGFGNPVVLRDHALPQIRAIEATVDRDVPKWYEETDHNFKRRDGMFRRFTVRALVTRDPIPELEKQLLGLRNTFRENREFDAAVLIILLQRIQEDLD